MNHGAITEKDQYTELRRVAYLVVTGLNRELNLVPGNPEKHGQGTYHYAPTLENAPRYFAMYLKGLRPRLAHQIRGKVAPISTWAGREKPDIRIRFQGMGHGMPATPVLEVPKEENLWVEVTVEAIQERSRGKAGDAIKPGGVALGIGNKNRVASLDFNDPAVAHVLLAGQTRSGKTTTEKLITWWLANYSQPGDGILPGESNFILIDTVKKGLHWQDFSHVAHLAHPVVTETEEADRVLAWAVHEIERRSAIMRGGDRSIVRRRIFIMIDELKALFDDSKLALPYLSRLAAVGGEFGIHLVLATQYPQINILGEGSAELKRNITTRLCGRVDDATAAANVTGVPRSGAETLLGYGDFLLRSPHSGTDLERIAVANFTGTSTYIDKLPFRDQPLRLPLPNGDQVNSPRPELLLTGAAAGPPEAPHPSQIPDPIDPRQVVTALWNDGESGLMGRRKLARLFGIGDNKAKRVHDFIIEMIKWGREQEAKILIDLEDSGYDQYLE